MSEEDLILVRNVNNEPLASSRTISHVFDKEHKHILDKIRKLKMSNDFRRSNFRLGVFKDSNGDQQPKFLMTRDACMMIIMSFNGERFIAWKEKFIAAFNAMEKELSKRNEAVIPQTFADSLRMLADEVEKNAELNQKIEDDKPRVEFAEGIESAENTITVGDLAKVLSKDGFIIGRNNLYKALDNIGLVYRDSQKNLRPYQNTIDAGWMTFDEYSVKKTKENGEEYTRLCHSIRVTGKGQVHISKKLRKHMESK